MLDPLAVTSFAMVAIDEVHVKTAVGTTLFDASNPCACSVWCQPSVTAGAAGVIVTVATAGAGLTVIVAVAVLPPLLSVIVVVPTPAAVTVIAAPLVAETLAIDALADAHPSGADGIGLFRPSKAWPVKLTVAPTFSVAVVGLTTTRATVGDTVVRSEAVSLAVLVSDPPLTVTVFVTLAAAFVATVTVTVTAGYDAPAANAVAVVQVAVATEQLQPEPLSAVAVKPAGSVSTTVTVPAVDAVPALETVH